ncbi:MAG TPA: hypothetical protein VL978_06900 [Puia sp.]|nr:hypothetical protein [Puia sp.]
MRKKDNHITEPSRLTRFRTFEEMKSSPFLFPSTKTPAQLHVERKEVIDHLRSTYLPGKGRQLKKTKKKTWK